ncbi:MAG: alpha/beta fold hydrolase [Dehalococcoidia bacterium]
MVNTFTLSSQDGLQLLVHEWHPGMRPRGVVCVLHGHGEHGARHSALGEALARAGFAVLALDIRGHGRSEGGRGHTPSYAHLLDDTDTLLLRATHRYPKQPCFLYGHSFGGNIALNHALRRPASGIAGVIVTCPWLRLTHEISRIRVALAHVVDPLWPSLTVSTSIDRPKLVLGPHDDSTLGRDPLNHDRISIRAFLSTRSAGLWALDHAQQLTIPALVLQSELDDIADPHTNRAFASRANGPCEFTLLRGAYHNVHLDPQQEGYMKRIQAWLETRVTPGVTEA